MDAQRQIEQMKQFIISEAKEKAEEIKTKAENEAHAWKSEHFRKMKDDIDRQLAKEVEQARIAQRVAYAGKLKTQRDQVLKARIESMDSLKSKSKDSLVALTRSGEYAALVSKLLAQAVNSVAMNDPKVAIVVKCRKADHAVVESCFKSVNVKSIKVCSDYLPDEVIGGVIVSAFNGAIICNNTLSQRLNNCMEEMMPILRYGLFH